MRDDVEKRLHTPEMKEAAFRALWDRLHTRPDEDAPRKECAAIAKQLPITFGYDPDYQVPTEALPREAYVMSVPFGDSRHPDKDAVLQVRDYLEGNNRFGIEIAHDAVIRKDYPMVDFVLKPLDQQPNPDFCEKWINLQMEKHKGKAIDPDEVEMRDGLWVVPPASYTFCASHEKPGKASLVYALFPDQICTRLQELGPPEQVGAIGLGHGDFAEEDFSDTKWSEPVTVEVGTLVKDRNENLANYYRYHGAPALMVDGQVLGTFKPELPKLPIGSTFEATIESDGKNSAILTIVEGSVQVPQPTEVVEPEQPWQVQVLQFESTATIEPQPTVTAPPVEVVQVSERSKEVVAVASVTPQSAPVGTKMTENLLVSVASVYEEIKAEMQVAENTTIEIDDRLGWLAHVRRDGDVTIRDESGDRPRIIAKFNIYTNEVIKPLSNEQGAHFHEVIAALAQDLDGVQDDMQDEVQDEDEVE